MKKIAFEKNIDVDDLLFYIENCIDATEVKKAAAVL